MISRCSIHRLSTVVDLISRIDLLDYNTDKACIFLISPLDFPLFSKRSHSILSAQISRIVALQATRPIGNPADVPSVTAPQFGGIIVAGARARLWLIKTINYSLLISPKAVRAQREWGYNSRRNRYLLGFALKLKLATICLPVWLNRD